MKAATHGLRLGSQSAVISIHAAREGGDSRSALSAVTVSISIHAAREGGDVAANMGFQPPVISIHAAREGGDGPDTRFLVD